MAKIKRLPVVPFVNYAVILCFLRCIINEASAFSCFLQRYGATTSVQHNKNTIILYSFRAPQEKGDLYRHRPSYLVKTKLIDDDLPSSSVLEKARRFIAAIFLVSTTYFLAAAATTVPATANAATVNDGASKAENAKITTGGASTLQSGRTISITRGVNLDGSDFSNQNLKGVAFQQSIVRDAKFTNSNLVGSSFFDATLDGSDFENAGTYIPHYVVCGMMFDVFLV